jgi:hypothetical protein
MLNASSSISGVMALTIEQTTPANTIQRNTIKQSDISTFRILFLVNETSFLFNQLSDPITFTSVDPSIQS